MTEELTRPAAISRKSIHLAIYHPDEMKPTISTRIISTFRNALLLAIACTVLACQETAESEDTQETEAVTSVFEAETTEPRPAPTFFVIPPDLAEKRVWICESTSTDLFHVRHDCPLLAQCKGKGSFRNLTLVRAIEDYGRYNCHVCSEDLDHIFDEEMVR